MSSLTESLNNYEESITATSLGIHKAEEVESLFSEFDIDEEKQTLLYHTTDDDLCNFENGQIDDIIKGKNNTKSLKENCQSVGLGLETIGASCL